MSNATRWTNHQRTGYSRGATERTESTTDLTVWDFRIARCAIGVLQLNPHATRDPPLPRVMLVLRVSTKGTFATKDAWSSHLSHLIYLGMTCRQLQKCRRQFWSRQHKLGLNAEGSFLEVGAYFALSLQLEDPRAAIADLLCVWIGTSCTNMHKSTLNPIDRW